MSSDIQESYFIYNELLNIRNVIKLTMDNLSALNASFSDLQDPPAMYIAEHEELSSKLQELKLKEIQLNQQLKESRKNEKSCAKFIRAHLPNKQRTSVPIKTGNY